MAVSGLRVALVLALALVTLLFFVTPALAVEQTHLLLSTFNGSPGAPQDLVVPTGIAVDNSGGPFAGEVYVAEGELENGERDVVDCFSATGEYLSHINGSETVQKSFAGAGEQWGLATDPSNGDLYVALPGLGVVDKFEAGCGNVVSGFGSSGQISASNIEAGKLGSPGTGKPFAPEGIAVDPSTQEVFVGDESNDVIDVFSSSGGYVRQFYVEGSPVSIAIDSLGDVFVANRSKVVIYEAATGTDVGVLDSGDSRSVAVDPTTEDVYVADVDFETESRDINQYAGSTLISSFGSEALTGPSQLAIGKAISHVYVTNNGGYVSIFGPFVVPDKLKTEPATEVQSQSAILNGGVNPNGLPVSECYFEYGPTQAYGKKAQCEEPDANEILADEVEHHVHAKIALEPDTAYHFRLVTVNTYGPFYGSDETIALPTAEADAVHTVNGEGKLSVFGVVDPDGSEANYRFEFLTEGQYDEGNWAMAISTEPHDAGAGGGEFTVQEVPAALRFGETYRFRVTVESVAFSHDPQHSPVKTLVIPPIGPETQPACPNEAERTGPSAQLPDCRAYEQVTPVNKEGAQDTFDYTNGEYTVVGLDGEHFFLTTLSKWGQNVGGTGPTTYSFTRTPEKWEMSSLSPQPYTGNVLNEPYRFFTPNLSQVLLEQTWTTGLYAHSPSVEYALGPPGGPYTVVASERQELNPAGDPVHPGHWRAQSRDGSVAVIESPDHELIPGHPTGTTESPLPGAASGQGFDLYEYVDGHLRPVNVYTDGETIGKCGAELAQGREGAGERGKGQGVEKATGFPAAGSVNAVSLNGSRIFFEAFPHGCPSPEEEIHRLGGGSEPKIELYMRVNGEHTVDIGDYTFEGANPEGTRVFLSKSNGSMLEFFSYDTETEAVKHLFSVDGTIENKFALSEDGDVFYFETTAILIPEAPSSGPKIYRYDIPNETMTFVAVSSSSEGLGDGGFYVSPEGKDFYFNVPTVEGVSGGARVQVYRYDNSEDVVQCISCASPYNPEPGLLSTFMPEYGPEGNQLAPLGSPASADGDYVFFDTPAALLPQDVNGEINPESLGLTGDEDFSPSSDLYEWRRDGVDGCGRVQGCLALITNGIDGTENVLLGTDPSGRDIFIATHSQLAPTDTDDSGDVYDARVDGGFPPPPPRPIECEGDACSTPATAPNDATPSSLTFEGPVDATPALPPPPTPSPVVATKCPKGEALTNGRCVKRRAKAKPVKRRRRAGRSSRRRGR